MVGNKGATCPESHAEEKEPAEQGEVTPDLRGEWAWGKHWAQGKLRPIRRVSPEETLGFSEGPGRRSPSAEKGLETTTRTLPGAYSRENEAVGWEVPSRTRTSRLSAQAHSTVFPVTETSLRVPLCDSEPGFLFGHLILGIMTAASKSQFSFLL